MYINYCRLGSRKIPLKIAKAGNNYKIEGLDKSFYYARLNYQVFFKSWLYCLKIHKYTHLYLIKEYKEK